MRIFLLYVLLAVGIGVAALGLTRIRLNTDVLAVLPSEMPEVAGLQAFQEGFARGEELVLLLEGTESDVDRMPELAASLTEALAFCPAVKEARWRPKWREDPDGIAELVSWLWVNGSREDAVALVARLRPDESPAVLASALERVATTLDGGDMVVSSHDPFGFMDHPSMAPLFAAAEESGGAFESPDGRYHLVFVDSPRPVEGYKEAGAWLEELKEVIVAWEEAHGIRVHWTGEPVFEAEIGGSTEKDMRGTIGVTSVLIGLLFWLMQRRTGLLTGLAFVIALVFATAAGLAGWIYGDLSIMSIGFAAILMGLVVDYGVLICQEGKLVDHDPKVMRGSTSKSILWASMTTAAVFFALNRSGLPGIAQLGTIVAIGIVVGAILMLAIYLPMAAYIGEGRPGVAHKPSGIPSRSMAARVGAGVLLVAIGILALKGVPGVEFDSRMLRPRDSEAMATFEKIREVYPRWGEQNVKLLIEAGSVAEMDAKLALAELRLEALKERRPDLVKSHALPQGWWADQGMQVRNMPVLRELGGMRKRLLEEAAEAGFSDEALALGGRVMEMIPQWMDRSADGYPVSPAALEISRGFVHPTGGGKGLLMGEVELGDVGNLSEKDLADLRELSGEGIYLGSWELLKPAILPLVRKDVVDVFLPMAGLMVLMLVLVFRRAKEVLLSLLAMGLSGVCLLAVMRVIGMEWNFLNIAATPLLLGTGLDYSIHILLAMKRNHGDAKIVWNGTGKAVLFCGCSTAIGFGSLGFASNDALASLGVVAVIGILITMLVSVLLLPALAGAQVKPEVKRRDPFADRDLPDKL